ncbi:hypothetical protein H9X57_02810 [Flavobacterium piscinae]|uniref:hypothetical protein n=1 Tax=Flavobacterium piscinae TaxID=2506424 RepID=UPI0019A83D5E|nr:hypothetical protein [Flavobacterium piscinae]MBC8882707.1 hypothetical protein [Flavobacterium piscinae]
MLFLTSIKKNQTKYHTMPHIIKLWILPFLNLFKVVKEIASSKFNLKVPYFLNLSSTSISKDWLFVIVFVLFLFTISYLVFRRNLAYNKNFVRDFSETEFSKSEYQKYFLSLSIIIPFVEIVLNVFELRNKPMVFSNLVFGVIFLGIYFLSKISSVLFNLLPRLFIFFYLVYVSIVIKNLVYYDPMELITFSALLTLIFFRIMFFKKLSITGFL